MNWAWNKIKHFNFVVKRRFASASFLKDFIISYYILMINPSHMSKCFIRTSPLPIYLCISFKGVQLLILYPFSLGNRNEIWGSLQNKSNIEISSEHPQMLKVTIFNTIEIRYPHSPAYDFLSNSVTW